MYNQYSLLNQTLLGTPVRSYHYLITLMYVLCSRSAMQKKKATGQVFQLMLRQTSEWGKT